jgi:hypothetical protein
MVPLRLTGLSVLNPPPGDWIMAVLKGFFDESGKDHNPETSVCSFAGYVMDTAVWPLFEDRWRAVLKEFDVPYLHMKEFGRRNERDEPAGPYAKWASKEGEAEKIKFFKALISTIEGCAPFGFGSAVVLPALRLFNAEKNLSLDAYSLGLYGCLLELSEQFPDTPIELILDSFDGAHTKIAMAEGYAKTDSYYPLLREHLKQYIITTLPEKVTFKCVLPIQAADFAAYEVRKSIEAKKEWFTEIKPRVEPKDWIMSLLLWTANKARGKPVAFPGGLERKSFVSLSNATRVEGIVWDYHALNAAHRARNGAWAPGRRSSGKQPS